jgi:dihydroorotate dehydrogenase (NAD+) catalytic subunit
VATARHYSQRPLIVKLSPNVTSIAQMAHVAQEAGADAVSLVNTFVAMAIDAETRKPRIANVTAGLSGPAIKPIALRMVYDAAKAVKIPVIGMGGISTAVDIVEFMLAGATAVQIGTASYWDPVATEKIVNELQDWCVHHRIEQLSSLTGGLVLE